MLAPLVLAVGCQQDGSDPEPEVTGTLPGLETPSPTPPVDPVEAALTAYRGMWAAYDAAGQPPQADPEHPDLARYATGDALEMLTGLLEGFRRDGLVFTGELGVSPEVTQLTPPEDPASARVEDCVDSSGWEVVRADGEPHEDEPGGRQLIFADVADTGEGTWTVTVLSIGSVGSC